MKELYEKLKIKQLLGHKVIVGVCNGKFYEGILDMELVNEDFAEDGEKPAIGLEMKNHTEAIYWEDIKFIIKPEEISCYVTEASA